jgi:hypothetical protein
MSNVPHQPPFYNVFSSFQWKMPLLPRPPVKADADSDADVTAPIQQMTSSTDRHNYTDTSASANVPITDQTTSSMNRKAPPSAPSSPPSPLPHHDSHVISNSDSSMGMGDMSGIGSMSMNERETMKFNKRPGTVKLIPTTTPVTCVEDLQKILLPTRLNNLGQGSASASLLALSNSSSSAAKMKSTGGTGYRPPVVRARSSSSSSSTSELRRQNVTPCCADYVPDKLDVIISQQEHQQQHQASPVFQRLLQQYATAYRERSTVFERRKGALQVMRAIQARGGTFLCALTPDAYKRQDQSQWAVVSNAIAERFIARVLEQVARNKQPTVSKMARTAQIVSQHRAPMKSKSRSAKATSRTAVHVLLHRHPVAPPRPSIKIHNKETLKNKKLALTKAVATLTKPVVQQQQQQGALAPPGPFHKRQRRSSSVKQSHQGTKLSFAKGMKLPFARPPIEKKQGKKLTFTKGMKLPFARPPIEKRPHSSHQDQRLQASAAALELYTNTAAGQGDEPPRRVSWDKATIEAQRRAKQKAQVQIQHQGQGRVSSVFNALDLLSSAAILDGSSSTSRSDSMSSDSGSSDSDSDDHSTEDSTGVSSQQQQEHQEKAGSLLKQRQEQLHRLNSSSVAPVVKNYDDAHIKADLSYIWR